MLASMRRVPLGGTLGVVLLALLVSGCYLPVRFTADVVLSRTGRYEMRFAGDVIWMPLYERLRKGELSPLREQEAVAAIASDLKRDPVTKEVHYGRFGAFRVVWEASSDLLAHKMISFVRRNERILSLKYVEDIG